MKAVWLLLLTTISVWGSFGAPTVTSRTCDGTATCAITIPFVGAGHLLYGYAAIPTPGVSILSVADNVGNKWYHPGGGGNVPTAQCAASDPTAGSVDCAFVLSATGGNTTVSFTFSAPSGGATVTVYEVPYTNGPLGYELPYALDQSSSTSTPSAPALNLRGTNDFIIQGISASQSVTSINGGYILSVNSGIKNTAYLANSTNGTPPTWTLASSGAAAVSGIAFAESYGTVPGMDNQWAAYSRALVGGCAVPENVAVGGSMRLTAARQTKSCDSIDVAEQSYNYSTHEVQMRTFNFLYGTIEFRMKIGSGGYNTGSWPVVWMLDAGCQPSDPTGTDNNCSTGMAQEIDIAEFLGTVATVNQQIHVTNGAHNDGCSASLADASQNL